MLENPNIAYIKNDKFIIKKLNWFNKNRLLKKVLTKFSDKTKFICLTNIDLNLDEISQIYIGSNYSLALEDCRVSSYSSKKQLKLKVGNFLLKNPNFNIISSSCEDLKIIFENDNFNSNEKKISIENSYNEKFQLYGKQKLKTLYSYGSINKIQGKFYFDDNFEILYATETTIDNNEESAVISCNKNICISSDITTLNACLVESKGSKIEIFTNDLNIDNSIVQTDNELASIHIIAKKITGTNYKLRSKNSIRIELGEGIHKVNYYFTKKDKDGYVTVTEKDFLKLNLINQLKTLKNYLNQQINERKVNYTEKKYDTKILNTQISLVQEKIELLSKQLEELNSYIIDLNSKKQKVNEDIEKSLSKKPISYLLKSNKKRSN